MCDQRHIMRMQHAQSTFTKITSSYIYDGFCSAAVVAETDVELYEVKYSEFDSLFETEVEIACKIYK